MEPRVELLAQKTIIGKRMRMSFANNKTGELWRGFMPRRKEIHNNIDSNLYSIEVYGSSYFDNYDPNTEFEKWAGVEVTDFETIPMEMETITIPSGLYAIFIYRGLASAAEQTYQYIFRTWLPNSNFVLDNRPHFAKMGQKYKRKDPSSEEELWIPIKLKK